MVRENLPEHAQDIYREAFNSAWEEYKDPSERRGNESREEVSHKVAWSAVEKVYEKNYATAPAGKTFQECYDVRKVRPTDEYMQVYDGARKKLEDLGLVF